MEDLGNTTEEMFKNAYFDSATGMRARDTEENIL